MAAEPDALGLALTHRSGAATAAVAELCTETKASAVYWNRRCGIAGRTIDTGSGTPWPTPTSRATA